MRCTQRHLIMRQLREGWCGEGRACSARKASGLASYTRRRCERGFMATPPYSSVLRRRRGSPWLHAQGR